MTQQQKPGAGAPRTPTEEAYDALQQAFNHYNEALFEGRIPYCLITMQRDQKYAGYFSPKRFVNRDGQMTDEIAINPSYFAVVPLLTVLQIIVHEMVHAWQFHFGKPSRRSYHNKEWGAKMIEVGLMPTSTGLPGGKQTGQRVSDFAIAGGPFMRATDDLLAGDFKLIWLDRFPPGKLQVQGPLTMDEIAAAIARQEAAAASGSSADQDLGEELEDEGHGGVDDTQDGPAGDVPSADPDLEGLLVTPPGVKANKTNRLKYRCPECAAQAWGKPTLKLVCGEEACDHAVFEVAA